MSVNFTVHDASMRELRRWDFRAVTLQIKVADLMRDMMDRLGPEHPAVGKADDLAASASELLSVLERMIEAKRKPRGGRRAVDNGANLLDLALRCEQATGPDRELDALIEAELENYPEGWSRHSFKEDVHVSFEPKEDGRVVLKAANFPYASWSAPAYTSSLDAAMSLAGENEAFGLLLQALDRRRAVFSAAWDLPNDKQREVLARFFTAASLRARAADQEQGGGR